MADKPPVLVAVDDGYRKIKLLTNEGGKCSQLSVIKSGMFLGGTTTGADVGAGMYRTEGAEFTVNEDIAGESTNYDGYALSAMNRVLVHHALYSVGLAGRDVILTTGLPLASYFGGVGGTSPDHVLIEGKKKNLAIKVESIAGLEPPRIIGQQVAPQASMAYLDYAMVNAKQWREDWRCDDECAVVDIGGRTTDTATILPGASIDMSRSGTLDVGMLDVFDNLQQLIRDKLAGDGHSVGRLAFTPARIEQFLKKGVMVFQGKPMDIKAMVTEAVAPVLAQIRREVQRRIASGAEMQAVILIGGGAALFADGLRKDYPHLVVPEDPSFANARGMLKLAEGMA